MFEDKGVQHSLIWGMTILGGLSIICCTVVICSIFGQIPPINPDQLAINCATYTEQKSSPVCIALSEKIRSEVHTQK